MENQIKELLELGRMDLWRWGYDRGLYAMGLREGER